MSRHHDDIFSCLLRKRMLSRSTTGFQRGLFSCILLLLLLAQMLGNNVFVVPHALAAGKPTDVPASFTAQQFLHLTNKPVHFGKPLFYPPVPKTKGPSTDYAHLPPSAEPPTMKPISETLSVTYTTTGATGKPLDILGSDGRLEVVIAPGALDFSHATVTGGTLPVGPLTLRLSQVHGHFIGQVSGLGGYEVQVSTAAMAVPSARDRAISKSSPRPGRPATIPVAAPTKMAATPTSTNRCH